MVFAMEFGVFCIIESSLMGVKVLDCTLRDGGYYNNWDFDPEVVKAYLDAIAESGIEFVELGLRNFPKDGFLGAFAYTTESFVARLNLPEGPNYGVMVDAKTILESGYEVQEAVRKLFVPKSDSKISLVRVAAHFHEVEASGPIVKELKALGYDVGYNLMQAGGKPSDLIIDKVRQAKAWNCLDVLYFADSLGNMDDHEVERIVTSIQSVWDGSIGIHTHDNMGKGLSNSLTARRLGVTWLDSTITGMGRGAGNTQSENLLACLVKEGSSYNPKPIYELVIRHFESMQKEYGWGSNILYFLGAQNDVHPTYIQNLLSNVHYGTEEIIGAIDYLTKLEGTTSYNGAVLDTALTFSGGEDRTGSDDLKGMFDNQDILIITNAPSTKKYADDIEDYIVKNKPVVVSVNVTEHISKHLIDYYVVSYNSKLLSDFKLYKTLDKPMILPKGRFSEKELAEINHLQLIDYGIDVVSDTLEIHGSGAVVPFDTTTAYLLAVLLESKVSSISVVGFDGYPRNDIRQEEMIVTLSKFSEHPNCMPIVSLTPSSYPVKKGSIYAPAI
jgi:4-hydroxy 2-oxovalerate aldolase